MRKHRPCGLCLVPTAVKRFTAVRGRARAITPNFSTHRKICLSTHPMEEAIEDYLEEYSAKELLSLIEEAQDVGGIRIFHHRRDADLHGRTERLTELFRDDEGYFIDESNWSDDHMSTYAWYLIDEATGELETRLKYPEVS